MGVASSPGSTSRRLRGRWRDVRRGPFAELRCPVGDRNPDVGSQKGTFQSRLDGAIADWALLESNQSPSVCKTDALADELSAQRVVIRQLVSLSLPRPTVLHDHCNRDGCRGAVTALAGERGESQVEEVTVPDPHSTPPTPCGKPAKLLAAAGGAVRGRNPAGVGGAGGETRGS